VRTKIWSVVALASLLGVATSTAAAQQAVAPARPKLDRQLRQRLGRMEPTTMVKAIITLRAGSKAAVREELVATGVTITADYSIIEALGVEMPAAALQRLAEDTRVIAVSADAGVDARKLSRGTTSETPGRNMTDSVGVLTSED
jgi:hypothetical protein